MFHRCNCWQTSSTAAKRANAVASVMCGKMNLARRDYNRFPCDAANRNLQEDSIALKEK